MQCLTVHISAHVNSTRTHYLQQVRLWDAGSGSNLRPLLTIFTSLLSCDRMAEPNPKRSQNTNLLQVKWKSSPALGSFVLTLLFLILFPGRGPSAALRWHLFWGVRVSVRVEAGGGGGEADAARGLDVCNYILISRGATVQSAPWMCKINLSSLYDGPVFILFNFVYADLDSCLPGPRPRPHSPRPPPHPTSPGGPRVEEAAVRKSAALHSCNEDICELPGKAFIPLDKRYLQGYGLFLKKKKKEELHESFWGWNKIAITNIYIS